MERQGVLLFPTGWDASPSQGPPPHPPAFHQASLTFRWNTFILLAPVVRCVDNPIRWIAQYVLWTLIGCIVIHHWIEISILSTTALWLERNTVKVKYFAQKWPDRPGLEPRPLDPQSSTLIIRPPRLPLVDKEWKESYEHILPCQLWLVQDHPKRKKTERLVNSQFQTF